nr:hypothetical protein 25 [Candidatus Omnitrophota bacterium]
MFSDRELTAIMSALLCVAGHKQDVAIRTAKQLLEAIDNDLKNQDKKKPLVD